ncbi:MAG: type II toxin-antitoxin system VapC family toxin [Candidatus Lokiarchaeota archaeon]|nr:type II toxin-antitoxin system VapC family toxin [Candidatus Lokiarchaeota archaeon]
MAVLLDTGFILAIKNRDDDNHDASQNWMKRFLKNEYGTIYTSNFVFDEVVTLALVRLKRSDLAISLGKYLLESPRIHLVDVTRNQFQLAWELFQKHAENRLSFTDCSILVQVKDLGCQLLASFDEHFKGLAPIIE